MVERADRIVRELDVSAKRETCRGGGGGVAGNEVLLPVLKKPPSKVLKKNLLGWRLSRSFTVVHVKRKY